LERAIPNQIRIRFEGRLQKDVPVLVRFAAPPPEGYEIVSQRVDPEQLAIIGPTSHVEGVEAVQTDPVDLSGVVGAGKFTVQTFIEDPQVRFVSGGQVNVEVEVSRKTGSED
jgi:YbbR domain-containing protein